ncbi:MAG: 4Fe-4S dicluster domain-containing protein [Bacteroidales bacterium]|nr:4Fe-4S dicluster domain-containing protein [Bacteroidales bacterium]
MTDFGFSIHEDLMIDHDRSSPIYKSIQDIVPSVSSCIACGSCTGTCISSDKTGTGFRKWLILLKNGQYKLLKAQLEYCQFCGKCSLVCPRGINTRKAILEMKKYFNNNYHDIPA